MQQFAVLRRPILGICRGLQTINVYFGGSLLQDIPGHSTVGDIDRLHRVRTVPSLLRELYGEEGIVNSAHHQAAGRLGAGLRVIQWAPDGTVEALQHTRFRCGPFNGIRSVWLRDRRELQTAGSCFRHFYSLLGKNEKKNEFTA